MKYAYLLAACVLGCGGGGGASVCGNGKLEKGEDCDDGPMNGQPGVGCSSNCTFVDIHNTSIQVMWNINAMAAPGFDTEPCFTVQHTGFTASTRITLAGPVNYTDEVTCDPNSKTYVDQPSRPIPAGSYMVTVRLFEVSQADPTMKQDLTSDVTAMLSVGSMQQAMVTVNFSYDKFLGTYPGTLFFQTAGWEAASDADAGVDGGGPIAATCAAANVNHVRFWLRQNGNIVGSGLTTFGSGPLGGIPMDGSGGFATCQDFSGSSQAYRVDLPTWGPYEVVVGGYQGGTVEFCSGTQVFVGAGGANPTYKLIATSSTTCP